MGQIHKTNALSSGLSYPLNKNWPLFDQFFSVDLKSKIQVCRCKEYQRLLSQRLQEFYEGRKVIVRVTSMVPYGSDPLPSVNPSKLNGLEATVKTANCPDDRSNYGKLFAVVVNFCKHVEGGLLSRRVESGLSKKLSSQSGIHIHSFIFCMIFFRLRKST